ncbi:MAG: hypothetical protein PHS27_00130 [Candidatus Pacebacteria bacterium]|nr:hypothetical protein [Candidatus Paceibacterota bacterium]
MTFLLHTAIGLLILRLFSYNPFLVLILAFLSHWIADMIPHFDLPQMSKKKKIILGGMDVIFSISLLVSFIVIFSPSIYLAIATFILSLFPDIFYIIEIFTGKKLLKKIFFDFHLRIQNEFSWGWIVELGFLTTILYFIFSK